MSANSPQATSRAMELRDSGGHFYRSDLQVHTPRDTQWSGVRPSDEPGRKAWANDFVAAARARELHAVAISDHHDFAFFPYVKSAAAAERWPDGTAIPENQRLVVFPAIEITLSVPCQAILLLDADFPEVRLDDVLKALHVDPIDPALSSIPQTEVLVDSDSINALHGKLDKHTWLKGRYIVLPHVTPKGHKTLLSQSYNTKYAEMVCVGGYVECSPEELGKHIGKQSILKGEDSNWGNKRLGVFHTSDSRTADFAELGENSTWIKWAAPTAEAIRQACLAHESRVTQVQPDVPGVWISRVVVSQSRFMGRVDAALNPQYTALIGGRGTGKSTVLDYLRWALCDQPADSSEDDEVANPRVRQTRLVEATLKPHDAYVEVHCVINGIEHVVRRTSADGSVLLKVGDAEFEQVRESVVQSLLPVQAYSQKQLSSVAIRLDELLRFVTAPIGRRLEDIARRHDDIAGRLRENYGTLQRYRNLTNEIERSELRASSIAKQAQALRNGLTGLTNEDRVVLDGKAGFDRVRAADEEWHGFVEATDSRLDFLVEQIDGVIEAFDKSIDPPDSAENEVSRLAEAYRGAFGVLRDRLRAAASEFDENRASDTGVALAREALSSKVSSFDATYSSVKERSSAHQAKLSELGALEKQEKEAVELAQRQRRERDALGDPQGKHVELRTALVQARQDRSQALTEQCEALSTTSGGLIEAALSARLGFETAQERFKSLVAGSNVRSNKIGNVFDAVAEDQNPAVSWESVLSELEELMLLEPDAEFTSEKTPVLSRLGLPVADQKRLAPRLTPDGWLDLSLVELEDRPEFRYRAKEGEYIPFNAASAGQQASALLRTLLAQAGTPLIIDQPEDDLDSDTVQQIVSQIWGAKAARQLIFSSHNANLVVNGDADLVLVCAYVNQGDQSAGHIKVEGAIDVEDVRNEITAVMEGGEKAFLLRKEKYGF